MQMPVYNGIHLLPTTEAQPTAVPIDFVPIQMNFENPE
jgi:hypothetical protein